MPDYKQGKIYSLRSHQTDQVYIGSTIQPLYKRLFEHKRSYKKWMNGKGKYMSSFEIVKYGDVYVELVEEYPCENKMQLLKREGEIIRTTEKYVNRCVAGRTMKEWYADNKETLLQKKKQYQIEHKNEIAQRSKKWREANREYVAQKKKEYHENNKEHVAQKNKENYGINRDYRLQQAKEYRIANKDRIARYREANRETTRKKDLISYHKRNPIGLATFGI